MSRFNSKRTDATKQQPIRNADLDACLIDDEFDDYLDCHVAAIRESLADFRDL